MRAFRYNVRTMSVNRTSTQSLRRRTLTWCSSSLGAAQCLGNGTAPTHSTHSRCAPYSNQHPKRCYKRNRRHMWETAFCSENKDISGKVDKRSKYKSLTALPETRKTGIYRLCDTHILISHTGVKLTSGWNHSPPDKKADLTINDIWRYEKCIQDFLFFW